jgi:hypothetical protein
MSVSRRTALSVLGLGAVAALPEDFSNKTVGVGSAEMSFGIAGTHMHDGSLEGFQRAAAARSRMSDALRRLADDVDAGGTLVQEMKLSSSVKPDDFLVHSLAIDFVLREDAKPIG